MKIAIIGGGNVATHLHRAFCGMAVLVDSRNFTGLPADADVFIVAVSDNAVENVIERLSDKIVTPHALVVHTAGSLPMMSTRFGNGVLYPMQTFSKEKELDYSVIPFFIEADTDKNTSRLMKIASSISVNVGTADYPTRKAMHIASVMACNFTNHLWTKAAEVLASKGLDFKILMPLIEESVKKLSVMPPSMAQTGPASRLDTKVVDDHIAYLEDNPQLQKIYRNISESIMDSVKKSKEP